MSLHRRTSDRLSLPRRGRAAAVAATVVSAALLLLAGQGFAADEPACTATWDGGAGNDYWDIAANWSANRLPGESDVVCIPGGVNVELVSAFATVAGLRSDSPLKVGGNLTVTGTAGTSSISSTLTFNGGRLVVDGQLDAAHVVQPSGGIAGQGRITTPDMVWNGGTQGASGTTEISPGGPGLSLGGDWRSLGGTRSLRIAAGATAVWRSGEFQLDGGHLDNFGVFEIRGDQDLVGCCGYGVVINEPGATIRRSSGNGEVVFAYAVANRGEFSVDTGRVTMQAGSPPGGDSDGVFNLSRDATLRIDGATTFAPGSRVTGEGSLVFGGGVQQVDGAIESALTVDGADVHMDSSQSIPRIEFRRGALRGDARVETPDLVWTGGSFTGGGRTVVTPGGAGLSIGSPAAHGLSSRTLEIASGAQARWLDGTLTMSGSAALENRGVFDIPADLPEGGSGDGAALIHNAAGAVLRKSGGHGTARIGPRFSNDGRVEALSGTLAFGSLENLDAGTLRGGDWLVRDTLDVGSDALVRNAASLVLDGPDSRVQDQNGIDALGALTENADTGSLTLAGGRSLVVPSYTHDFENTGTIDIGPGSTFEAMAAFRQTAGSTRLADFAARIAAGGGEVDIQGGRLNGPGTVDGTLRNGGVVAPASSGDSGPTPGTLMVLGDYVQTAAGTLEMRIADPGVNDHVAVAGAATLAGALRLESLNGFVPSTADEFELVQHDSLAGEFDRVEGLTPAPGHTYWPPDYQDRSTALRRGEDPSLSIADVTVAEVDSGDVEARFAVTVSQPPTHTIHVAWSTADGSATAPSDYEPSRGTITIPHGQTSAVVTVPVHGDLTNEPDETFHVDLSDPSGASIAVGRGTATVADNDPVPSPPIAGDPSGPTPPTDGGNPSPPPPPSGATPPPTGNTGRPPKIRPRRCADRLAPLSAIGRPKPARARRRKRTTVRGIARDRGCAKLRKVTIAVARRVRVGGRDRCRWMGPKGGFGRPARCDRPRWVAVRGLAGWRLKLARPLAAGRYLARSRAVDRAGNLERKVRTRRPGGANAVSFRVR